MSASQPQRKPVRRQERPAPGRGFSWPPPANDEVEVLDLARGVPVPSARSQPDEEAGNRERSGGDDNQQDRQAGVLAPARPRQGAPGLTAPRTLFGYEVTRERIGLVVLALLVITQAFFLGWNWVARSATGQPASGAVGLSETTGGAGPVGTSHAAPSSAPSATTSGVLMVGTEPAGAAVTVDGTRRGVAPLTVADLEAGEHDVVIQSPRGTIRHRVRVRPGETTSLLVPLGPLASAESRGPTEGTLAVQSPIELRIFEDDRLVGTSAMEGLRLRRGAHRLVLRNDEVGFEQARTVTVTPGRTTTLRVDPPTLAVAVNAVPWAEVWVDGRRAGETPIGGLPLSLGAHTLRFRHPQLGEKSLRYVVRADDPARISIDMRK